MISYLPMSTGMKCANCDKGIMHGHNMSHAKNRTNRIFEPNLHSARVMINGAMKRVRLCSKCLRKLKKAMKPAVKVAPQPAIV
jgi:large subunit ribosomal protein L28